MIRGIIDERSYIESVYEFEDDEEKYVIRQVQNDQLIYESIVKVEEEQDEIKVKMEIESPFEKSSYEMKYEIDTDRPMIKVEYETENYETEIKTSGEMKIYVVIDEITLITSYQIVVKTEDDEYTEDYERNLKHDEDDEDEDDEDDEDEDEDDEQDEDDVE